VISLLQDCLTADSISSTRFTRQVLLDPNFRPEAALVALNDEEVSGFCLAIKRHTSLENAPEDQDRGYIPLLAVKKERRCQGIATHLLEKAERYLTAQGCTQVLISPYAPNYFIPGIDVQAYPAALELLINRGYEELYRPLAMQTSLATWSPTPKTQTRKADLARQGITLEPYRSELTLPLLDFVSQEFPGDWVRIVRETMHRILQGDSCNRLLCLMQSKQIIGFAHHDQERFGPIGVAKSQRGRGLGQILLWETLRAQREQGLRTSWFLWSDDRTAAGLYSPAGFEEMRRFAILKKAIGRGGVPGSIKSPPV
jgi:ribosomal protein S18 acetylase RimI-like enzyme